MNSCLFNNGKRFVLSLIAIMMAGCLYAVTKTAVFDFTNPNSLSIEGLAIESGTTSIFNMEFEDGPISIKFGGTGYEPCIRVYGENNEYCARMRNGNTLKVAIKNSNVSISVGATGIYAASTTKFKTSTFQFGSGFDCSPQDDGNWYRVSGTSVDNGWSITCNESSLYIGRIEVEYSIEESEIPELPEIKDMPTDVLKTVFDDFDGTIGEMTDYVFVAGNVVATGNLLDNGHLEVVRFTDGVKSFPVDYAFRFKELYDGEFVIQNKRNEYLSAGENGHFALTSSDEEALLWSVSAEGGMVDISESSVSRSVGKSILFSESAGGFGRYDAGEDAVSPTIYAYTSPTTGIVGLVENNETVEVYYDLRGNIVNRDRIIPGIYICRKGAEVRKVAITE